MKKFVSILLAAMLLFALAATAMAAETVTITVTEQDDQNAAPETYTAYKILDATKTSDLTSAASVAVGDSGISYTVPVLADTTKQAAYETALGEYFTIVTPAGSTVKTVTGFKSGKTADQTSASDLLAAAKAAGISGVNVPVGTATTLPVGYYVIESSLGSQLILLTTNMSIEQKNYYPSFTKAFDATPAGDTADANAKIDDTIEYVITVTVPETVDKDIIIHDTLASGLQFVALGTVENGTASVNTAGTEFTVPATNAGKTVTIHYTAKLTSAARSGNNYTNTAYLTYSNYQSVTQQTVTKTNKITVNKYKADTTELLPGAVLQLQDANGNPIKLMADGANYRLATAEEAAGTSAVDRFTTTNAAIVIEGIDSDLAYKVAELEAPSGYNPITEATDIPANAGNDSTAVLRNYSGTVLPSTGSIGTTIFYVIGGLLIVAAGVLLITKKRMSREG